MAAALEPALVRFGGMAPSTPVRRVGFWSAVVVAASCLAFMAAAVLQQLSALAPPWAVAAPLLPPLVLAITFWRADDSSVFLLTPLPRDDGEQGPRSVRADGLSRRARSSASWQR